MNQRLRLSLGERWKITEIRRQLNDTEVEVASIGYLPRPRDDRTAAVVAFS